MSHRLIKQPNGKYAVYSTIVDDLICANMTVDEIIENEVKQAVDQARVAATAWLAGTAPGRRFWRIDEIVRSIRAIHGDERADAAQRELDNA